MEVIVIGGGAAGLFCAGFMADAHRVTIIEHSDICGKKLLITGKGRCNVTNDSDEETILKNIRTNPKFMFSSIYQYPPRKVMEFFESRGVPLKTERGRRVFPVSDKAMDIKKALEKHCKNAKIIYDDFKAVTPFPTIKFRKMKSRWGSCQPQKNILTFNTLLLTKPFESIKYVVIHEFCHFIHPNHSKAFYAELEKHMPDYKIHRQKLK